MFPGGVGCRLFFDGKLAAGRLAQAENVHILPKKRPTTGRRAWEPRLHDPFLPKWLHRIDVPVKIIWGREDRILPVGIANELKRLMPTAEVHILENCGHLPHAECADDFVELVCR